MNIGPETNLTLSIASILGVVIFFVVNAVKLATYKATVDNRIVNLEEKCKLAIAELEILKNKVNNNDVIIMEIRTTLKSIEASLLELKERE